MAIASLSIAPPTARRLLPIENSRDSTANLLEKLVVKLSQLLDEL